MNELQTLQQVLDGAGSVGNRLLTYGWNARSLRPFLHNGRAYVEVFNAATGEFDVRPAANATLRYDEWKEIDRVVMDSAYKRLTVVRDLEAMGLTHPISNGMGRLIFQSQKQSDISDAEFSMHADTRSRMDRPDYETELLPLPVAQKDFQLSARVLEASRQFGDPLDLVNAELAGRKVAELIETTIINGASITYGGGTVYGLANQTNVNTVTMATYTGGAWDGSTGVTGAQILSLVVAMKQAAITDRHYGPYMLYIPTDYETILDKDFDSTASNPLTIKERLKKIDGLLDVKVADFMAADTVILVEMSKDTIRLIDGLNITTVEWDQKGGLMFDFKVMAIRIPQVRADHAGRSGVVVAS